MKSYTTNLFFKGFFLVFTTFFTLLPSAKAQFEVGVFAGAANYQGDLADAAIIWRETQLAFGVLMRYTPHRFLTLRAHYIQGKLQASDYNSSQVPVRLRGFRFSTPIRELSAIGEFNFLGNGNDGSGDEFNFRFTPYFFTGLGITSTNGSPVAPDDTRPYPFPENGAKNVFVSVPIGFGFKIQPFENFSLGIEGGSRTVFSDRLDGASKVTIPASRGNDWYLFGGLILTYCFSNSGY